MDRVSGAAPDGGSTERPWQRLHPVAVLPFAIGFVVNLIRHGWQGLAPLAVVVISNDRAMTVLPFAAAGLAVTGLVFSALSYLRFHYRIDEAAILIRRGVFNRKRLVLGFDRVQAVSISDPPYFRPFGLVSLNAESAGSVAEEVSLTGVPRDFAENLKARVLDYQAEHGSHRVQDRAKPLSGDGTKNVPETQNSRVIATASSEKLIQYALSSNNIWLIAGLALSFLAAQFELLAERFGAQAKDIAAGFAGEGLIAAAIGITVLILLFAVVLMLFSIGFAIWRYHGYRLVRRGDRLERRAGLVVVHDDSLKLSKIQCLVSSQNIFARLMRIRHMRLVQAGSNAVNMTGVQKLFNIPSRSHQEEAQLAKELLDLDLSKADHTEPFTKISAHILWQPLTVGLSCVALVPLILGSAGSSLTLWGLYAFAFTPLVAVLRYRRARFAVGQTHGVVESGTLGRSRVLFPLYKVQHIRLSTTGHQRFLRLATLKLYFAGRRVDIPYIPERVAQSLADHILATVETSQAPWI